MRDNQPSEDVEILLLISGDSQFLTRVEDEFARRHRRLCIVTTNGIAEARQLLEVRPPAVILLDGSSLAGDPASPEGRKPTLWASVTSLAESAPVVVIGSADRQAELTALLASGVADYVTHSEYALGAAIGLVERRLRHRHLHPHLTASAAKMPRHSEPPPFDSAEPRDFGEVLRHELNNPLTGILGNAELLLVELRRRNVELPPAVEVRLETIATLAVRMRETVRRLSEEWEANSEKTNDALLERHP